MRTRQEIKAIAKVNFRNNYGTLLGIMVVFTLITGALSSLSALTVGVTGIASLFISLPLSVGMCLHYTLVYKGGTPAFATMFNSAFSVNYSRKLGGSLWQALFLWLWSLLFFIPAIFKFFSYAATPYILANYPEVKAKDALKLSMRVMKDHWADLFVFMLSFIGWYMLSMLTCGILLFFYVGPYYAVAAAGFFTEIIDEGVRTGVITEEQLQGAPFA